MDKINLIDRSKRPERPKFYQNKRKYKNSRNFPTRFQPDYNSRSFQHKNFNRQLYSPNGHHRVQNGQYFTPVVTPMPVYGAGARFRHPTFVNNIQRPNFNQFPNYNYSQPNFNKHQFQNRKISKIKYPRPKKNKNGQSKPIKKFIPEEKLQSKEQEKPEILPSLPKRAKADKEYKSDETNSPNEKVEKSSSSNKEYNSTEENTSENECPEYCSSKDHIYYVPFDQRPSSPTNSNWSISTTATFKHDIVDSHYSDMCQNFRENDLNNMSRSQILQEYFLMERVNNFLEEKCFELDSVKDSNKKEIGKKEDLSKEDQIIIKDLVGLGIDPVNNIKNIKENLNVVEEQLSVKTRQIEGENNELQEKLNNLIDQLSIIKRESVEMKSL